MNIFTYSKKKIFFQTFIYTIEKKKRFVYKKMTSDINEIRKKALGLSSRDRALLIRQLLESLEEGEEEDKAEELWIEETKLRYDLYKQGKTSERPANQVLKNAKSKLK